MVKEAPRERAPYPGIYRSTNLDPRAAHKPRRDSVDDAYELVTEYVEGVNFGRLRTSREEAMQNVEEFIEKDLSPSIGQDKVDENWHYTQRHRDPAGSYHESIRRPTPLFQIEDFRRTEISAGARRPSTAQYTNRSKNFQGGGNLGLGI